MVKDVFLSFAFYSTNVYGLSIRTDSLRLQVSSRNVTLLARHVEWNEGTDEFLLDPQNRASEYFRTLTSYTAGTAPSPMWGFVTYANDGDVVRQ